MMNFKFTSMLHNNNKTKIYNLLTILLLLQHNVSTTLRFCLEQRVDIKKTEFFGLEPAVVVGQERSFLIQFYVYINCNNKRKQDRCGNKMANPYSWYFHRRVEAQHISVAFEGVKPDSLFLYCNSNRNNSPTQTADLVTRIVADDFGRFKVKYRSLILLNQCL